MKKIVIFLILILFSNNLLFAQLKKANRHFELFRYSKAIPLYKRLVDSNDGSIHMNATERLADCYRLTNNIPEARAWYSKAVELEGADPINYYYLGQASRSMAFYKEAENAFIEYSRLVPDDKRGAIYAEYARQAILWESQQPSADIRNLQIINTRYSDFGPAWYKNGIIFSTDRKSDYMNGKTYDWTSFNYLNLYYSEPLYYKDYWSDLNVPEKMPNRFNQSYHDGPAVVLQDNNTIFITRTMAKGGRKSEKNIRTSLLKIFYGQIPEKGRIKYKPFPFNSDNYSVGHPAINQAGNRIIFSSNMPGGLGGTDLYMSEFLNGEWSEPINMGSEVNTFGNEVFPTWVNDTLLYFSSDGLPGLGGLDIFQSTYSNGKWHKPINLLSPINSSYDDFGIIFTSGNSSGLFSSNRPGGMGSDDIYAFRNFKPQKPEIREKPEKIEVISPNSISGYVKDKTTNEPLPKATVFIVNTASDEVLVLKSDDDGYYEAPAKEKALYVVKAMMNGHFDDCLNYRTEFGDHLPENIVLTDLLLDKFEINKVFRVDNIYYDLDRWEIRHDARPALDNLVSILKQYPISVEIGSHTDSRASDEYNQVLSQRRAESVVSYLIMNGINPARLTARGYGETRLVNHCSNNIQCSELEHQANRRTEFRITELNLTHFGKKQFDPDIFKHGDKIPLQLLESDFFNECLKYRETK